MTVSADRASIGAVISPRILMWRVRLHGAAAPSAHPAARLPHPGPGGWHNPLNFHGLSRTAGVARRTTAAPDPAGLTSASAVIGSRHLRRQLDRLAIHHERAVALVMDRLRMGLLRVRPGFHHLHHEQIVFVDQPGIDDPAFQVGEALSHQWRCHKPGRHRRQPDGRELVHIAAGAIAHRHDFSREVHGRHGDHAFTGGPQRHETVIAVADHTGNQRRFEFHHHMPRQRHDIRSAFPPGRQQNDGSGFEQLIDPG